MWSTAPAPMQSQTHSVGLFGRLGIGTQLTLTIASLPSPSRSHRADRNLTASTAPVTTTTNNSSLTALITTTTNVPSATAKPTTSLPEPTQTAVTASSPSVPVGAIAGIVIGGFLLLSFTVAICFWKTRRRTRPKNNQSGIELQGGTHPVEMPATNLASEVEGDQGRVEADHSPNSGRLDEEQQGGLRNVNTS